jgi:hypothetical protein
MGASASREKFSESVSALIEKDVSPDDAEFWDELWKIPNSVEEVFELITPEAARLLRDEKFDNLATLFTQAIAQLCQIVETPYSIYFDQALNCVRVLTRMLPFLLERGMYVYVFMCVCVFMLDFLLMFMDVNHDLYFMINIVAIAVVIDIGIFVDADASFMKL